MFDKLFELLGHVVPPDKTDPRFENDEYDGAVKRWRWWVFYWIGALTVALAMHIILVCGFLPMFYPGFALASDQKQTQDSVRDIRVDATQSRIFDLRIKQCKAIKDKEGEVRVYTEQLQQQLTLYRDLTGKNYANLPACDEL